MSEKTAATSLAIVEKKPHRPGGCVGIFFQLFDWNRGFAKKKLFSKKLLPPVLTKKSSTKFGADEKLPKLRMAVADENSGGFPQVKKNGGVCDVESERKHQMRVPGLVARLMGLESMPAGQRDKLKKAPLYGTGSNKENKFVDGHSGFERQELTVEKEKVKNELRPQKLRKTGMSGRKPVTRLGAEALQLKNVLSRSRKHHQKFVSPVKSPRNHSRMSSSRLIGAATRILEPGLQRSRSKCALTYSTVGHHPLPTETLMKEAGDLSTEPSENSNYSMGITHDGQSSSCRNCGHSLDIVDLTPNTEDQPPVFSPVSEVANHSCQMGYPRLPIFRPVKEKWKYQKISPFYASLAMDTGQPHAEYMSDNKPLKREDQRHRQATSQHGKFQKDGSPSVGLKQKAQGQKQMFQGRDRIPLKSKVGRPHNRRVSSSENGTNEGQNFVAMTGNSNNHAQLGMPAKRGDCQFDTNKKTGYRRLDCLSPVQKRRSMNISRVNEGHSCVSSDFMKTKNIRPDVMSGKQTDGPCTETRLVHLQENLNGDRGKNEVDVTPYTFNSPTMGKAGFAKAKEKRNENGSSSEVTCKMSALQKNDGNRSPCKSFPSNVNSLIALLEQKLRELTCQDEDGPAFGDTSPKKTTARIVQELISALVTERSCHQDDSACKSKNESHLCNDDNQSMMNTATAFLAKVKSAKNSVGYFHDYEHLSPGSVLEPSFSNDSCGSSCQDDSSRYNICGELTEFCEEPHSLEPDANLLDSFSSFSLGKFCRDSRESVDTLLNNISEVLSCINIADDHLKGCKLSHAKEVILNAEMMLGSTNGGFSIGCFVLNELETLASSMCTNFGSSVGFDDIKEGHQLKGFVFDCVIEYLDSGFSRHSTTGFNAWTRLPLHMKTETMMCDIVEEVERWAELAGLFPDDLIEYEMSHSLEKWTDFELEAFETGVQIGQQILQILVDELVIDFTCGRTSALDILFRPF